MKVCLALVLAACMARTALADDVIVIMDNWWNVDYAKSVVLTCIAECGAETCRPSAAVAARVFGGSFLAVLLDQASRARRADR